MKKILNFFFDSGSDIYASSNTFNNLLLINLGNDSFLHSNKISIKDIKINIDECVESNIKSWNYVPSQIFVKIENNTSSNCSFISNVFSFFTILGRTDILTENIFNDANNPITYNTHMFSTNTDKTMPFIDLSSNILALSFWGFNKKGPNIQKKSSTKGIPKSLFLTPYVDSVNQNPYELERINIFEKCLGYDDSSSLIIKVGININVCIEIN